MTLTDQGMRTVTLVFLCVFTAAFHAAVPTDDTLAKKTNSAVVMTTLTDNSFCRNIVGMLNPVTKCSENYVLDHSLYFLKTDTLPQVRFWRDIMNLHQDTAIVSFANSRERIEKICVND